LSGRSLSTGRAAAVRLVVGHAGSGVPPALARAIDRSTEVDLLTPACPAENLVELCAAADAQVALIVGGSSSGPPADLIGQLVGSCGVKVVVAAATEGVPEVLSAIDAGAHGYVLASPPERVLAAILAAAAGEFAFSAKATAALVESRRRIAQGTRLSEREHQVLALLRDGLPNKRIASELGISERTVKAHLTRIYEHLGVSDRTQAALWVERHGHRNL
jgi:DNA-binding NarL/FixJ family response regulator